MTNTATMKMVQLTKQGYQELSDELAALQEVKRPKAVVRVQTARDFGDLSENAEYHAARDELNFIDGRIDELEDILLRAKVAAAPAKNGIVGLGCKVTVAINGSEHIFTIVGEWEANPQEKKISHDSPLGKALIGKKAGDKVSVTAPAGEVIYTIKKIH